MHAERESGDAPLPDWVDPRLVVGLRGADGRDFVIDGSPDTQRGLIRVFSPDEPYAYASFSVRPDAILPRTESAACWIGGFVAGNQPPPEWIDEYIPDRRGRAVDFFRTRYYSLPPERSGSIAFNVTTMSVETGGRESPIERLSRTMTALVRVDRAWDAADWIPIDRDRGPLDAVPFRTPAEISTALSLVNHPATLSDNPDITLMSREPHIGQVELRIEVSGGPASADAGLRLTLNLETLDHFGLGNDLDAHQDWLRETFGALVGASTPDVASLSFGAPLRDAAGFRVPSDWDVAAFGLPGWLTYLAAGPTPVDLLPDIRQLFDCTPFSHGSLYEFSGPPSAFTTAAADRLGTFLAVSFDE